MELARLFGRFGLALAIGLLVGLQREHAGARAGSPASASRSCPGPR